MKGSTYLFLKMSDCKPFMVIGDVLFEATGAATVRMETFSFQQKIRLITECTMRRPLSLTYPQYLHSQISIPATIFFEKCFQTRDWFLELWVVCVAVEDAS